MGTAMTRNELKRRLMERAVEFGLAKALVDGATFCNRILSELDELWSSEDSEWLPATMAADRSGFSEDHLRRRARTGRIVADKRGRNWWYLAASLPTKANKRDGLEFDPHVAAMKSLAGAQDNKN